MKLTKTLLDFANGFDADLIDKGAIDFGVVKPGQKVPFEIAFDSKKGNGSSILYWTASCNCTNVKVVKEGAIQKVTGEMQIGQASQYAQYATQQNSLQLEYNQSISITGRPEVTPEGWAGHFKADANGQKIDDPDTPTLDFVLKYVVDMEGFIELPSK